KKGSRSDDQTGRRLHLLGHLLRQQTIPADRIWATLNELVADWQAAAACEPYRTCPPHRHADSTKPTSAEASAACSSHMISPGKSSSPKAKPTSSQNSTATWISPTKRWQPTSNPSRVPPP